MKKTSHVVLLWLVLGGWVLAAGPGVESYAGKVSSLVDPAKLATLGERGANPRVQKYVALLAEAKAAGVAPDKVGKKAVALVGMKGQAGKITVAAMVRNLTIAERLGCLDAAGLADMRKGQAPTVRRGPCQGAQLSVDHIIPRAVCPELDKVIANLELMPLGMNQGKSDAIGKRQKDMARKFHKAGLLSDQGLALLMARR